MTSIKKPTSSELVIMIRNLAPHAVKLHPATGDLRVGLRHSMWQQMEYYHWLQSFPPELPLIEADC